MVTVVMPCFRRADLADRNANRWLDVPGVDRVEVLLQPLGAMAPVDSERIRWVNSEQVFPTKARNTLVDVVEDRFHPKLVLVTDDDVMPTSDTVLLPLVDLALRYDTGVIAITRKVGTAAVADVDLEEPVPYIGGGYLIEPRKYLEVGGFPFDMGDEKGFGLALYLAGYRNYRTRRSLAIHEQGKAGAGGPPGLFAESASSQVDMPAGNTMYGKKHRYLRTEPAPRKDSKYLTTGSTYILTEAARYKHKVGHDRLKLEAGVRG